ncbi:MAG: ferrous iron transport protein A [Pseudomonadota bacterium]
MTERTTLNRVAPKQRCRIVDVGFTNGIGQRLMEMGLVQGSVIEVVRFAPLGDPMEIRVGRYRLSLRKADAEHVEVELCP